MAFKPYGKPPPFDLDEFKDTFELWEAQWQIFLDLSTIDTALDQADRPKYKANLLKSSMSKATLAAILSSGLSAAELIDPVAIIAKLRERCNAGRNHHVWRHTFALRKQRENELVDDWLCDLRDIARKCEFANGCCAACEPTRILGQVVFGAFSDEDRRKLLEKGAALTLDDAVTTLRTTEAAAKQSANLRDDAASIQQAGKSAYKKGKTGLPGSDANQKKTHRPKQHHKPGKAPSSSGPEPTTACRYCGAATPCSGKKHCPAGDAECTSCGRTGHFAKVCLSKGKAKVAGIDGVRIGVTHTEQIAAVKLDDMVSMTIIPKSCRTPAATVKFLPDTGAEIDAIPSSMFQRLFKGIPLQPAAAPETAVGSPIGNDGTFAAAVDWEADDNGSRPVQVTIHVLQSLKQAVLSKTTQLKLGMLPARYPHSRVSQVLQDTTGVSAPNGSAEPTSVSSSSTSPGPFAALRSQALSGPACVAALDARPTQEQMMRDLQQLKDEFPRIFDGKCRPMVGPPCHFEVIKDAVPVAMRGSRPVAEPLVPHLRAELDSLEADGIIRKVADPTAWVHPIVTVPKRNGKIRLCVDFRNLNRCIVRPRFETATPFQAVRTIPAGMRYFTVIDALKGYHQVPLDEESSALTTFSTPFGRYQYLRLPFGVTHAGDDYSRRVADVFDDIPSSRRVIEDIVVFSSTYEEHKELVRTLLARANKHQVAVNVEKMVFAESAVKFGGYTLDANGFRPDPELTRAIAEFPTPLGITDLRSFFGLCQQVGNFSDRISTALVPLSPLLKKGLTWEWTTTHDQAFKRARAALSTINDLAFYDPGHPTALHVDASRLNGLGFVLKQKGTDGSWKMVQAGSRFLSAAESRYAMIELECLGAAWAMAKCRQFLEGLPGFELVTDHKPLVPILNEYSLDKLDNPRLLRLRLKMQRYAFRARWIPGKANLDADALSRAPVDTAVPDDELAEGAPSFPARLAVVGAIGGSDSAVVDPVLEKLKSAASVDPVMIELRQAIVHGFPNDKCNLSASLRPFWCVRDQLAIDSSDDMIVMGSRIVVPKVLQRAVLQDLLKMHQGATKLRQRARLSVYWPNMDAEITNASRSCKECTSRLPSHPAEPLRPHEPANRPFEQVHGDLGTIRGRHFLVLVDQYSGWPHVVVFKDEKTTARRVIDAVRAFFISVGVAVKFWSDNGPQFASAEFAQFLREWGVSAGTSSPHFPQSNGIAEAGIKSIKKLLAGSWTAGAFDEDEFGKAILLFRNAPRNGGPSPAQMVFRRPVRDCLPAHRRSFASEWQQATDVMEKKARRVTEKRMEYFNRRTQPLTALVVGNHVVIQHPETKRWATPGVIIEVGPNRDYLIKTAAGRVFRRNRRFLRRLIPVMPAAPSAEPIRNQPLPAQIQYPPPAGEPLRQTHPVEEPPPPVRRSFRTHRASTKYPEHSWTK